MKPSFKQAPIKTAIALAALLLPACSPATPPIAAPPSPLPVELPTSISATPTPTKSAPAPAVSGDPFQRGIDAATSAAVLAQDAKTPDDWSLVLSQWQRAIEAMKVVPRSSPRYATAQKLRADYQQELTFAQQRVKRGGGQAPATTARGNIDGGIPLIAIADNTDAASTIRTLNQQQIDFFNQQKRFATNLAELGSGIVGDTPSYTFYSSGEQAKQALSGAIAKRGGLPTYLGAVYTIKEGNNTVPISAICVVTQTSKAPPAPPRLVGKEIQCPEGTTKV